MIWQPLRNEFSLKLMFPTPEHIQAAYEQYCIDFAVQPIELKDYIKKGKLELKQMKIPDGQCKALACIIPLIQGLKHIILENNALGDEWIALLFIACYMNPDTQRITLTQNYINITAAKTFYELSQVYKEKIVELNLHTSIISPDHAESFVFDLPKTKL